MLKFRTLLLATALLALTACPSKWTPPPVTPPTPPPVVDTTTPPPAAGTLTVSLGGLDLQAVASVSAYNNTTPQVGHTVTIGEAPKGSGIAEGVTDASGLARITLPAAGTYIACVRSYNTITYCSAPTTFPIN